jgi:ubiquinone/menaquinone biosynthesis C-methylase UbiE
MRPEEYYRVASKFYDADYATIREPEDVAFYLQLAQQNGGPVLEMGCGTGRVLLPIARSGIEIHGLDASEDMLAVLRDKLDHEEQDVQRRVSLTEGDIRTADLDQEFPLIIAPFRVIQHMLTREDQKAWLGNVARHLGNEGSLCFDVFQPNYAYIVESREPKVEFDYVDAKTGVRLQRIVRRVHHPEWQLMDFEFEWKTEDSKGNPISDSRASATVRWFTRSELENLLDLAGFEITDYWGSFKGEPFGEGSPEQIIRAKLKR